MMMMMMMGHFYHLSSGTLFFRKRRRSACVREKDRDISPSRHPSGDIFVYVSTNKVQTPLSPVASISHSHQAVVAMATIRLITRCSRPDIGELMEWKESKLHRGGKGGLRTAPSIAQ